MEKLLLNILKDQVKPALGCTEPVAIAYGVARAKELLNEHVEKLVIKLDKNIFKNAMYVSIPGTEEKGPVFASALALVIGTSKEGLECLKQVDEEAISMAKAIIDRDIIELGVKDDEREIYIDVRAFSRENESRVLIKKAHTNIVFESLNDKVLLDEDLQQEDMEPPNKRILNCTFNQLVDFVNKTLIEDLSFIKDGIHMNLKFAKTAKKNLNSGIGSLIYENIHDSYSRAKAMTALASQARMSGFPQSVMSCAGSGNNGLIAIIPISIIGKEENKSEDEIIRAVTLSLLISIYMKARLGPLSPICGGGIAGGSGFACALTYLLGGSKEQIAMALNNMIAGISGMICDGAKIGCAYKLSISVDAGKDAALMALAGIEIPDDNGVLGSSPEETIENLGSLSNIGMNNTDRAILDIMLKKC